MKRKKIFQKFLNQYEKKELFLWGFYISFLVVMTLACVMDFIIQNSIDAYIELFFILLTLISFIDYRHRGNIQISIYGIIIIATLTTYALLVSNHFNISIFHIIVPLGYFLLFSLMRSLLYTFIHQAIVLLIYTYGYYRYPNNQMLHDPAILVAIVMASLMIIFFGIVYHISVENSYIQLHQSNRQKEILLKEVHHRVKNNLNIISSILGLQLIDEKDEKINNLLTKNRLRINSIAMVHEQLYKHSDFETINLYEYLSNLVEMIIDMYNHNIQIYIDKKHIEIPFEKILKLGIITNELTINSIKHAFKERDGIIKISFTQIDDFLLYEYQDNGDIDTIPSEIKNPNSLGLKLVYMMAEEMEAEINIDTTEGLKYTIRIPNETHN